MEWEGLGGAWEYGRYGRTGWNGSCNSYPQPAGDPKEVYKSQLEQLAAMGFTNESVNIDILKQTGGNVEAAVERLLRHSQVIALILK